MPDQMLLDPSPDDAGAEISPCRAYRYLLWRSWGPGLRALFIMLNPSTADAYSDDATIRRCRGFARSWGFDGFEVVNLFGLRTTWPKALYLHHDPVGQFNDSWITQAAMRWPSRVVCAWGNGGHANPHPTLVARASVTLDGLRSIGVQPWFFKRTNAGQPAHPLYQPGSRELRRMTSPS